jgi:hypothetical protein
MNINQPAGFEPVTPTQGGFPMKRTFTLLIVALFLAAAPLSVNAKTQGHGSSGHGGHSGHGNAAPAAAAHEQHGDHAHDYMEKLGVEVVDGVKAAAHLDDVREAMAKAGMKETHHLMVFFLEDKSGAPIETGTAALKIKGPNGKETGPIRMVGMEGHFGADIVLTEPGHYEFTLGTRLADGKTRQFEFMYMH